LLLVCEQPASWLSEVGEDGKEVFLVASESVILVLGWLGVGFDLLTATSSTISVISLTFVGSAGGPEEDDGLRPPCLAVLDPP
jgi:hypothetical protein